MNVFHNDKHGELFMRVCAEHSAVIPEGRNGFLLSDDEGLRTIAKLQQKVQALEHEKALRESEERFRLLVEAVQDYAIFMLDAEGRVRTWNRGAERIKGYSAAEILGEHFSCFYSEEDQQTGKPQRMLETAVREGRIEDQGWRVRKDGSRSWANALITALRDRAGNLTGFSKVTRDITEQKLAEQALLESQRKINESEKSLRQLSHHLLRTQDEERQRIGRDLHDSLGQYLSMLKMKLDSVQTLNGMVSLNVIKQRVGECADLAEESIKEVRTISYLLYPPLLEELGLQSAISWYLEGFTKHSGIKATLDMPAELGRFDHNLELAIFRVLQESLTNVHRHSGSPTAGVRVWVKDGILLLEVRDQGKGIRMESVPGSGQDLLGALGVGLRGMNERMRQLGGRLELASSPTGTTLTAAVPAPNSM
jgi:PAS domain S-box-containing protein